MYTEAKYQYQVEGQKAIKFVLPANLEDKYRQYDEQTKQLLKSTEKCPFTSIRQLIIAFKTTKTLSTDLQKSDILRQKYQENNKLQRVDMQINNLIQSNQLSQARSLQIFKCINQYNKLYANSLANAQLFIPAERPFVSPFGAPIIPSNRINRSFLQKQSNYFHFLTYSNQLERALVLGNISHPQLFKNQSNLPLRINDFRVFYESYYNVIKHELNKNSQSLLNLIFNWRVEVKQGRTDPNKVELQLKQYRDSIEDIDKKISSIQKFNEWLVKDRQQIRKKYEQDSKNYKRTLINYTKEKQKYEITQNKSYLNLIIKEEKIKLQDHLKKNYCVIVNYIPSDEYAKVITPIKDHQSFRDLLRIQIEPLQLAFNYINHQYQQLYRDACQNTGPSRLRSSIQNNIRKFRRFLEDSQNSYFVHLISSCQRLLQIVR